MPVDGVVRQNEPIRSQRIAAAVADYLRRLAAGDGFDEASFIAANPDLAPELAEEIRKARLVAAAFQHADQSDVLITETHRGRNSDTDAGRLEVRCPSCHTPIDVAVDTSLTDLTCSSCGSHFSLVDQSQATHMAPSLSTMGRFELIERLGVGGFGAVWKARDKELDRTVAVKVPRQGGMTGEEQEKFFREARAAAQLRHPGIVSVHEVGRDGDSIYIVSDFVRGVTLGDWLTGQKLTSREAAELCAKIADALHHAHEKGVVHRDLKPANIMIDGDGQPHLMDFGLARREAGEVTLTMDGQVLGTPAYMSPEQAKGEAHSADRRSDVYSLGVILFQLLTGELPFRGNARMLVHQVISDEPPSPRKLNSIVSRDLETITLKCLEKDAVKRYQTARDLFDELQRVLSCEPILARPVSRAERAWRWCRRNPLVASLSASVAFVLLIGSIASSILGLEAHRQSRSALMNQRHAEIALAKEQEARQASVRASKAAIGERDRAMESLYYAILMAVPRQIEQKRFDKARQLLAEAPVRYRSWEWGYFARLCHLDSGTLLAPDKVNAATFGPDGSTFAVAGKGGGCAIYSWPNHELLHHLKTKGEEVTSLAYSPDGRILLTGQRLLSQNSSGATLWDVSTGQEVLSISPGEDVMCVGISRDGDSIATGGYDGSFRIWSATTGAQIRVLDMRKTEKCSLAFSPTQDLLATAVRGGSDQVKIWDYATGEELAHFSTNKWGVEALAFSPDGKTLAVGLKTGDVEFRDVAAWKPLGQIRVAKWFVWSLAFSPDGQLLACGARDPVARIYSVSDRQLIGSYEGHGLSVNAVSFSEDGRVLLTGSSDRTSKLWAVNTEEQIELAGISEGVWPRCNVLRFTPDGNLLAVACTEDDFVRIWDVEERRERIWLGPHPTSVTSLDLSANGRHIAVAANGVYVWNLAKGTSRSLPSEDHNPVACVSFSPDGNTIAASRGTQLVLHDLTSDKAANAISFEETAVEMMRFCPTGKRLASIHRAKSTHQLCVWDIENLRQPVFTRPFGDLTSGLSDIAFSPDGKQIAIGGNSSPYVLNAQNGHELFKLKGNEDYVSGISYGPDGRRIATVTPTGSINIWDASNGRELLALRIAGSFYSVQFSSDNRFLAVGGRNGNSAGVMLLTAFPWINADAETSGSLQDDLLAAAKSDELQRVLAGGAESRQPITYALSGFNPPARRDVDSTVTARVLPENRAESVRPPVEELRKRIGSEQTVVFRVQALGGKTHRYLNSRANYTEVDCFTAVVETAAIEEFDKQYVDPPVGKLMRVTGKIEEYDGRIQIRVTDLATQLQAAEKLDNQSDHLGP